MIVCVRACVHKVDVCRVRKVWKRRRELNLRKFVRLKGKWIDGNEGLFGDQKETGEFFDADYPNRWKKELRRICIPTDWRYGKGGEKWECIHQFGREELKER